MLSVFEKKVADYILHEKLLPPEMKVLVAVSGGADSVCMLYVLYRLCRASVLNVELVAGHINHNLRPDAAKADQDFTADLSKRLGINITIRSIDTIGFAREKKLSIETAARELRRNTLLQMAEDCGCDIVATAHHMDDNAETVIHRLIRGTGYRGLGGIRPIQDFRHSVKFIRPMLCVRRQEIIDYCKAEDISWMDDHTNEDIKFTRNKIRHLLLPEMENRFSDSLVVTLSGLSEKCRNLYNKICLEVDKIQEGLIIEFDDKSLTINRSEFNTKCQPIQAEVIRRILVSRGCGERDLKESHYNKIIKLSLSSLTKRIQIPYGFTVLFERNRMVFFSADIFKDTIEQSDITLSVPGFTKFGKFTFEASVLDAGEIDIENLKTQKDNFVEWFDLDKIKGEIIARRRHDGDRFYPIGGTGQKKVGKFLTAQRISNILREIIIIITDSDKIIWVAPIRASELTRITNQTKKILQLKTIKSSQS